MYEIFRPAIRRIAWGLPVLATLLGGGGLVAAQSSSPSHKSPGDAAVFAAVVDDFKGRAEGQLRVDSRVLLHDRNLEDLQLSSFAASSNAVVARRSAVIREKGVVETDAVRDTECMFARGVPNPPEMHLDSDSALAVRRACRAQGLYTTIAISAPEETTSLAGRPEWRVAVIRMTTWSYEIWEARVNASRDGGVTVVGADRKFRVAS